MPITLEKIYEIGEIVKKNFYSKTTKRVNLQQIKGLFSDIGKKINKEGKTSVDLVREIRKAK